MGRAVWPGEPFSKKCPNIEKSILFSKYACPSFQEQVPKVSFSLCHHRQPLAMGSSRGGAPRKCRGVWGRRSPPPGCYTYTVISYYSISRYTSYTKIFGPSVFPEKQVTSEWLVLQYFQKSWLYQNGSSFSISQKAGYAKMLGPSVFPDTRVEKSSFETQN